MDKHTKEKIKQLLRIWGSCEKTLQMHQVSCERLEKIRNRISEASGEKGTMPTGCNVVNIRDLQRQRRELEAAGSVYLSIQAEMELIVGILPWDVQAVLRARYVACASWETIGVHLPFAISLRQCYRLHLQGMEMIAEELEKGGRRWDQSC